jgi:hypothetical protein
MSHPSPSFFLSHDVGKIASHWFHGKICITLHVTAFGKTQYTMVMDPKYRILNRIHPNGILNAGETQHIYLIIDEPQNLLIDTIVNFQIDTQKTISYHIIISTKDLKEIQVNLYDVYAELKEMLVSSYELGKNVQVLREYLMVDWNKSHPEDVTATAELIRDLAGVPIDNLNQLIEHVEKRMETRKSPIPIEGK